MKMKQIRILPLILLLGALLLVGGCTQDSTGPQTEVKAALEMSISGITADGIARFILTVYDFTGETIIAGPIELAYNNGEVSGSVNVPADEALLFVIEALGPEDEVLYRGSQLGRVSERETLTLTIQMNPALPMLWTTPVFFPAQAGQEFRVAVRVHEMPTLQSFEAWWEYPINLISFDSGTMNDNVSNDIGFFAFDSGNGNGSIVWYMNDYKPLTENTSPTDSITLGWMYFTVQPELNSGGRGKIAVRQINYAFDTLQNSLVGQINTNSTEVEVSLTPIGRVPQIVLVEPAAADTVQSLDLTVQILDDKSDLVDERLITLLVDGVAQPSDFRKKPGSANLYIYNFGIQVRQARFITYQIIFVDSDGNIVRSESRTVWYEPPPL